MGNRIAIVVVVDGLRADALACYGNARAETPFLDHLAAESALFDFAFCLDPTLASFYGSVLHGVHPVYRYADANADVVQQPSHAVLANSARHVLVTDDPAVAALDVRPLVWSDVCSLTPHATASRESSSKVDSDRDADARRFFESTVSWLNARIGFSRLECEIAWVHASHLAQIPPSSEGAAELQTARERYDGAVTAIDAGIRTLLTQLSEQKAFPEDTSDILFVVVGARGLALGERGNIGADISALHEELLHIPLIVHHRESGSAPFRSPRLTSPVDVHALLSQWSTENLGVASWAASPSAAEAVGTTAGDAPSNWLLFANAAGDRALRTPGWYLIQPSATAGDQAASVEQAAGQELYLKPDDRWECNEILDLRPEIAAALRERLDNLLSQAAAGLPLSLPPLPADLIKGG